MKNSAKPIIHQGSKKKIKIIKILSKDSKYIITGMANAHIYSSSPYFQPNEQLSDKKAKRDMASIFLKRRVKRIFRNSKNTHGIGDTADCENTKYVEPKCLKVFHSMTF